LAGEEDGSGEKERRVCCLVLARRDLEIGMMEVVVPKRITTQSHRSREAGWSSIVCYMRSLFPSYAVSNEVNHRSYLITVLPHGQQLDTTYIILAAPGHVLNFLDFCFLAARNPQCRRHPWYQVALKHVMSAQATGLSIFEVHSTSQAPRTRSCTEQAESHVLVVRWLVPLRLIGWTWTAVISR
jgi:hypothetical protein